MKISSYNITDVGYHYIGLRVLAAAPTATREVQFSTVARNVAKYASDKALRLMLPEPRGNFETVGEKVCQELAHFSFAQAAHGKGYELTDSGKSVLGLLNNRQFGDLRRLMAEVHLATYDNLRQVVQRYVESGPVCSPIVEAASTSDRAYITHLMAPTFGENASVVVESLFDRIRGKSAKKIEDVLRESILERAFPGVSLSVALFRAMGDRLVSLRLLNSMKVSIKGCDFAKSYSPCVAGSPPNPWYVRLNVHLPTGNPCALYMSDPDMSSSDTQEKLLSALDEAFATLSPLAGYHDLPEVRDYTCERMMIPEAAFDEGVNSLLDLHPAPLTVGLQYERISGRRKPLVRSRETVQIYNLIRRT